MEVYPEKQFTLGKCGGGGGERNCAEGGNMQHIVGADTIKEEVK